MNKVVKKWTPILKIVSIDEDYWEDIAKYCERFVDRDIKENVNFMPMSLKVFSQLDLSRVLFTDDQDICEKLSISISVAQDQIIDLKHQLGIDVIAHVESSAINELSNFMNEKIKKTGGIVINEAVSFFGLVENNIIIESYVLPYDVYRYKKLAKLTKIINDSI